VVETGRIADRDAGGIYSTSAVSSAMGSSAHKQTRTLGSITKILRIEEAGVHLIATGAPSALTMRSMTKTPVKHIKQQMEFMDIEPDRHLPSWNGTAQSACCGACGSLSGTNRMHKDTEENIQMLCDLLDLHRI